MAKISILKKIIREIKGTFCRPAAKQFISAAKMYNERRDAISWELLKCCAKRYFFGASSTKKTFPHIIAKLARQMDWDGGTDTVSLEKFEILRSLLIVKDVEGMKYVRLGKEEDGGYVMVDYFPKGSVAYSFGINNDVSWDTDAAKRGLDVFMFDHTIEKCPQENPKFHYFKLGIAGVSGLKDLKTMQEFIEMNGHSDRNDIVLKMDVEGAEWDFLNNAEQKTLEHFSQIVLELHELTSPSNFDAVYGALEKLNKTHQLVHIHANNCAPVKALGGIIFTETLEATFLRKSDHKFTSSTRVFPTELDMPNKSSASDVFLGKW